MALYYWQRYNVNEDQIMAWGTEDNIPSFHTYATNWSPTIPKLNIGGTYGKYFTYNQPIETKFPAIGETIYVIDSPDSYILKKVRVTNVNYNNNEVAGARTFCYAQNCTFTEKQGSFITTLQADYNAYTNNVRNSDGYWYVRGEMVNNAPNYSQIPAQSIRKNSVASINLPNYFTDAEGNPLTYSASSNNTGIATVSIAGGILTVTGRSVGNVTITVTANDGNLSTSQTFPVTVANTDPVGTTIPNQTTKKSSKITVNLANYFSDVDNDALTFTATSANTNVATVSVSGNTLTINGVSIGTSLITVTVSDSKATASQSFTTTVTNSVPTLAVTAPAANVTLYENDLLYLAGQAADVDANQSVTVYAQINNEQRIVLGVGLSNAPVTFSKALKFKGGQLFDGETPITGNLTDGIPHILKIWAQDGDGAQSAISERTFYVVPNRPPILTVDTVVPSGIINTDKFTISGTAADPDGNTIFAAYRVNNSNNVTLEINDGKWVFDITLAQLEIGQNTIVVEVLDTYNSKVSKTIKLNKNEVKTPILHSVARYKIEPPKGSAKGVLLYLQRDEDLTDLTVELSMVIQGEKEKFITLTTDNTAPIREGIVEDEFYFEAEEAKNHIILKLSTTRADVSIDHKIHLISGVLE